MTSGDCFNPRIESVLLRPVDPFCLIVFWGIYTQPHTVLGCFVFRYQKRLFQFPYINNEEVNLAFVI